MVSLTRADCDRGVHYFNCGLLGPHPECKHRVEYKECKNCGKVVWLECERCYYDNLQAYNRIHRTDRHESELAKALIEGRREIGIRKKKHNQNRK